jgi:deoxyribonuclease IV
MRIGAHVSNAGGVQNVFERAAALEAEAIQTFLTPPQQWRPPTLKDGQLDEFRSLHAESGLPVFLHGVYLINLASDDDVKYGKAVESLKQYLTVGAELGCVGTIFHVGSHLGRGFEAVVPGIVTGMREALDFADNDSLLIMENNAGQGNCVGATFKELGDFIRAMDNHPRLRVCLDTCHAFAMGYDLRTTEGCAAAMDEFDREIGLERLAVVHANDSKGPLGGVKDRHENIGEGEIGLNGFRSVMAHPAFADVSFLLEVPGFEGEGPDLENINRLKAIRGEAGAPGP